MAAALTGIMLRTPPPAAWILPLGVAWSLVILTIDAASGNTLRQWIPPDQPIGKDEVATARGLMLAFVMLPPALLYIHRDKTWRRRSPRAPLYVAGIGAAASGVLANGAAFFAGVAAYIIGSFRPQAMLRAIGAIWGLIFAAPFLMAAALPKVPQLLTVSSLPDSVLHRLIIWRTVLDLWAEGRTLTGAGARATHTLTDRLGAVTLESGAQIPLVSSHPHNLPVQLLYEFGLIGYGLVIAFLVMGARALLAVPWRKEMAIAIAGLLSVVAVYISVEMDFWHLYTWCALSLSVWGLRAIAKDAG
ncbi:hypothetical protein HK107_11515 [Parvularcula sp. ZS-1/3]|uniref:O-antigen ligase domain-containing protein n=2 Tax=Parvularcula mediterranea TaxID=2732508 RepID=A0A7Y3RPE2_9PROT|nr:hypothetical protein [Parvularcula mediterranea]